MSVSNSQDLDQAQAALGEADDPFALNVKLSLSDLLPDAKGEIVILSEGDDPHLSIVTDLRLLETGIAGAHVTDTGIDVKGLQYWIFEDGTKLYYSPGLDISLDHNVA